MGGTHLPGPNQGVSVCTLFYFIEDTHRRPIVSSLWSSPTTPSCPDNKRPWAGRSPSGVHHAGLEACEPGPDSLLTGSVAHKRILFPRYLLENLLEQQHNTTEQYSYWPAFANSHVPLKFPGVSVRDDEIMEFFPSPLSPDGQLTALVLTVERLVPHMRP